MTGKQMPHPLVVCWSLCNHNLDIFLLTLCVRKSRFEWLLLYIFLLKIFYSMYVPKCIFNQACCILSHLPVLPLMLNTKSHLPGSALLFETFGSSFLAPLFSATITFSRRCAHLLSPSPSLPINKRQRNISTIHIENSGSNLPPSFHCTSKIDKLFPFQERYACLDTICSCGRAM